MYTVEPLIKDALNNGHLCMKDTFQCTSGSTLLPLREDNLSIMDKMIRPNVSEVPLYMSHSWKICMYSIPIATGPKLTVSPPALEIITSAGFTTGTLTSTYRVSSGLGEWDYGM